MISLGMAYLLHGRSSFYASKQIPTYLGSYIVNCQEVVIQGQLRAAFLHLVKGVFT